MIIDWDLDAGEAKLLPVTGRYLRILSGAGRINVDIQYPKSSHQSGLLITGLGLDFTHPDTGEAFNGIIFKSDTTQTITILASDFPTTDSRLTGDVDINGLLSVVSKGGSSYASKITTLVATTAVQVADAKTTRLKGTFNADVDGWLYFDNTAAVDIGVYYSGSNAPFEISNTAELWFYPLAAGTGILLEDIV